MAYACKILADSISPAGHRLTTFLVTFPRIVLAEVNTHRMISKNSASSRAIPVATRIASVSSDPFIPEAFGRNRPGMQSTELLENDEAEHAARIWMRAKDTMITDASDLAALGVHKQLANRLLEPFSWHTAILSGTDWSNFFNLRVHPAAQGEFTKAARMMKEEVADSTPVAVNYGDWHLPLVRGYDEFDVRGAPDSRLLDLPLISAGRCARVTMEKQDLRELEKDQARGQALITNGHMSPLEHPARPMTARELSLFSARRMQRVRNEWHAEEETHYLGNFNGWVQLRKLIPNEHDSLGIHAEKSLRVAESAAIDGDPTMLCGFQGCGRNYGHSGGHL